MLLRLQGALAELVVDFFQEKAHQDQLEQVAVWDFNNNSSNSSSSESNSKVSRCLFSIPC